MHRILLIFVTIYSCFGQAQSLLFDEVGTEKGLNYIYPGNEFQMAGGGVMVIDVNNDGWDDFFQSGGVFNSKLWLNAKGTFVDATDLYGVNALNDYFIQGAVSADYDNDGFQDFIVVNYGIGMGRGDKFEPCLMHNINGEKFELISLKDVVGPGNFSAACWGDVNNDGFSDVYLTNYIETMGGISDENGVEIGYNPTCFKNKLLINVNGTKFVEKAIDYGVNDGGCGLAASLTDVDLDGDLDLLLLNDFGEWTGKGNKYYRNDFPKEGFTDISDDTGFNQKMYGMGIGQGDIDSDGDLDYYVTNIGENYFFKNQNGALLNSAKEDGVDLTYVSDSIRGTSWSGLFFDCDFDGDLDLYVSKGNVSTLVPKTVIKDQNKFFVNENGKFIDKSQSSGVNDLLSHRGAAIFDFDLDGDLDIVSSVVKLPWSAYRGLDQKLKLFKNTMPNGNFVAVKLSGINNVNRDCFGCKAFFEQNGNVTLKEVDGGSGQASQSSKTLYFGLGDKESLDQLKVVWPDGTVKIYKNLKSNTVYHMNTKGKLKIQ